MTEIEEQFEELSIIDMSNDYGHYNTYINYMTNNNDIVEIKSTDKIVDCVEMLIRLFNMDITRNTFLNNLEHISKVSDKFNLIH